MTKKEEPEKMSSYTFRLPGNLLDRLKEKAGLIPVSVVLRKLIEKYLRGEIDIDK